MQAKVATLFTKLSKTYQPKAWQQINANQKPEEVHAELKKLAETTIKAVSHTDITFM